MEQRKLCEYLYLATTRCNCKCRHCTPKLYTGGGKTELTSAQLIQRYEESYCLQNNAVSVAGGEPFLKEDLAEFVLYLDQKKIPCIISTNGWFTDKIEKLTGQLQDAQTVRFSVSVDGIGKVHDEIRGLKGAYQRALDSIRLLKDRGFGVQVNCVAQKDNLYQVPKIKALFGEMDVPLNMIPKFKIDNEAFEFDEGQIRELYPYIHLPREKKFLLSKGDYRITKDCHAGKHTWVLDANGDVYACCGGYYKEKNEKFVIDNLCRTPFDELFLSPDAEKVYRNAVVQCEGCANCRDLEREVTDFDYSTEFTLEDLTILEDRYTGKCCMEDINCDNYNWHGIEQDTAGKYRWMKHKSANVFLKLPQAYSSICIHLWNMRTSNENEEKIWVSCAVNGEELGRKWCALGEGEYNFPVANQNLEPGKMIKVTIGTNLEWVPKASGIGEDNRTLGLAVRSVEAKDDKDEVRHGKMLVRK